MDINLLRGLATLAVFLAFIAISIAVYSSKRKAYYEQAGRIPFREDDASLGQQHGAAKDEEQGREENA